MSNDIYTYSKTSFAGLILAFALMVFAIVGGNIWMGDESVSQAGAQFYFWLALVLAPVWLGAPCLFTYCKSARFQ